jgi:hypothetical protein
LLAGLGTAARLGRLLVILPATHLPLDATSLQEFPETAHGRADWFSFVNSHP